MYMCSIILAAGEGKRMKSKTPKVLHKVCGKEMVNHVIDSMRQGNINDVNVVIGNGAEKVRKATENRKVNYSLQEEQKGTGHAVICAEKFLENKKGLVVIFTGDAPLIKPETVKQLINHHESQNLKATILTSIVEDPKGYGRIIRNEEGNVEKIVEHKDCNEDEIKVKEINSGMYCFDIEKLLECLNGLTNENAQGEYYLTDVISIMKKKGYKVGAEVIDLEETLGVNSRVQLYEAEEIMRARINKRHMENGVTIIDPRNTYIGAEVQIGADCIIYPGNILEGNTMINSDCVLYPNNRINNSTIEKNVNIQCSVIIDSFVGEGTTVGPYAYVRPQSEIGRNARIGDFVEIKKSIIGDNTKVSHLTYIGDAEVGSGCNFGCGTVVVNYDGKNKYKTIIGNNAFIGCNTNLVSPVEIKDNAYIAAGSTITKEVPEGTLAVARAKQVNIEGWVEKKGLKK